MAVENVNCFGPQDVEPPDQRYTGVPQEERLEFEEVFTTVKLGMVIDTGRSFAARARH